MTLEVSEIDARIAAQDHYDLAVWAAGYEQRAGWLVQSEYCPLDVDVWRRVVFADHADQHSAMINAELPLGAPLAGSAKSDWDGFWSAAWSAEIASCASSAGRPIDIYVDYSSMPRTVYGPLLLQLLGSGHDSVRSITLAYVPGRHGADVEGSRRLDGLRSLPGCEGRNRHHRSAAMVLGLGYDGLLTETVVDVFQVQHFGCFFADPGVETSSVERLRESNRELMRRAEVLGSAPVFSIHTAYSLVRRLIEWYEGFADVVVVPLGPKPHVVASLLACHADGNAGFRWVRTSWTRPVQVMVVPGAKPYCARIRAT